METENPVRAERVAKTGVTGDQAGEPTAGALSTQSRRSNMPERIGDKIIKSKADVCDTMATEGRGICPGSETGRDLGAPNSGQ